MRSLLSIAAIVLMVGCAEDPAGGDRPVSAVVTTGHVADLTRNVGGARVDVHLLVPPGADPHGYEPRPSDARAIALADVIVRSGGEVDDWLGDVLSGADGEATELTVLDQVEELDGDPHWWQDPRNAVRAVAAIRGTLVEADPGGRSTYTRNAARYTARLRELDRAIAICIGRVPRERRKLVTAHDSYAHFAGRYGMEVLGAVIPSRSTAGAAVGQGHAGAGRAGGAGGSPRDLSRGIGGHQARARRGAGGRSGAWPAAAGGQPRLARVGGGDLPRGHGRGHGGHGGGLQRGPGALQSGHSPCSVTSWALTANLTRCASRSIAFSSPSSSKGTTSPHESQTMW